MLPARTRLRHTESLPRGGHRTMGEPGRQMHLGVFVLGTVNHMAGWRYEGAFATHMELPVMQEIARIAEREASVAGALADGARCRPAAQRGRFAGVRAALSMARRPRGLRVIAGPGGPPSGVERAAGAADVVFSVVQELAPARKAYADLK